MEERADIIEALDADAYNVSAGGSLSNSLVALSRLGAAAERQSLQPAGLRVAMAGVVGGDPLSHFYSAQLQDAGVSIISLPEPQSCTGALLRAFACSIGLAGTEHRLGCLRRALCSLYLCCSGSHHAGCRGSHHAACHNADLFCDCTCCWCEHLAMMLPARPSSRRRAVSSSAEQGVLARAGTVMVLTTPDANRTMLSYLGTQHEVAIDGALEAAISSARVLTIEGYLWEVGAGPASMPACDIPLAVAVLSWCRNPCDTISITGIQPCDIPSVFEV